MHNQIVDTIAVRWGHQVEHHLNNGHLKYVARYYNTEV
jgi:hypothetical protein